MNKTTTTIAIDPGSKSGVAVWRGGRLLAYGLVKSTAEEIDPKISGLREILRTAGVELVGGRFRAEDGVVLVTEAQYLKAPPREERWRGEGDERPDASAAGRFSAALSVATNATVWRTLARVMKASVADAVQAATWRSTFGISKSAARPDLKKQAIEICRDRLRVDVKDDVAEAILLGLHCHALRLGGSLPSTLSWVLTMKLARKAATAKSAKTTKRQTTELF